MPAVEGPLGRAGLLRVAGLPVRHWLSGANPELFAAAAVLVEAEDRRRADGPGLALRVGEELVPHPDLPRQDRARLLEVRRCLHRAEPIASALPGLRAMSVRGPSANLLAALVARAERDRDLELLAERVAEAVDREQERLLDVPARVRAESPVAAAVLPEAAPTDVGTKARRHRSELEWRLLARASTRSTPRGWFSHVALQAVADLSGPSRGDVAVQAGYVTQWTQNVRAVRRASADPPADWPSSSTPVALNPLQWPDDGRLVSAVLDQHELEGRVVVRRTELLDAVCATLEAGARPFQEVADLLGCGAGEEREALRGFVRHLVVLGVLQGGAVPQIVLDPDAAPDAPARSTDPAAADGGWIDVYRHATGALGYPDAIALQEGVTQALRVLSLADLDLVDDWSAPETDRTWTFAEVLAAELGTSAPDPTARRSPAPDGRPASSRLPDLLRAVAAHTEPGMPLVLDSRRLDEAGATPAGPLPWPSDCLLRLPAASAGYPAVLEQVWPAAALDSRFADALAALHGAVPQVEAYRDFLREVEELTGFLLVEILAPPLADGAANAVRRPVYTRAWTGDPHLDAYVRGDPGRYVPLGAIRVRRTAGRLEADVDGQPIWPVHHATRSFSPPWDRIAEILLATSPLAVPRVPRTPLTTLAVPAGMTSLPRVTVTGGLVLAPAQWLVSRDELGDPGAPVAQKVRALVRLRRDRGLSRWVWLVPADDGAPVPCDLESLHAIRALERGARSADPVHLVEMLPAPDELRVADLATPARDRVVSQVQLRLPCDESPTAVARRIAPNILARVRSTAGVRSGHQCRDPPRDPARPAVPSVHTRQTGERP